MRIEDEFLTPAREALGTQAWDAAAVEGAALGFRDAIAYAPRGAGVAAAGLTASGQSAVAGEWRG
jgi:hypothetical protein